MKKKLPIIITIVVVVIVIGSIFFLTKNSEESESAKLEKISVPQIVLNDEGSPKFVEGSIIRSKVEKESDIFKALMEVSDIYGFNNPKDEFNILNSDTYADFTYYKLEQKYKGISLYGYELVVSVDKDNKVSSLTGNYFKDIDISSTYYSVNKEKATEGLKDIIVGEYEVLDTNKYIYIVDNKAVLSYVFSIVDLNGYYDLVISGKDGSMIDKISKSANAEYEYTGIGSDDLEHTVTIEEDSGILGTSYKFHDPTRNITIVDAYSLGMDTGTELKRRWGNIIYLFIKTNLSQDPISAKMEDGVLVHKYPERIKNAISTLDTFSKTYDYYYNVLGRKSYDNKGAKLYINIGAGKEIGVSDDDEWVNACWNGGLEKFFIGSSEGMPLSIAVDVSAHEFTHAVIQYTAGLVYKNESGALNEGYADIMGNLIEGKNFQVGESVKEFRDMADPNKYEDPSEKDGKYYFPTDEEKYNEEWREAIMKYYEEIGSPIAVWTDYDNGGVHTNSGVVNHAAYLMYTNGAFKDMVEMSKVFYNSLFLMTSTSDFEDCALAVIQSAKNLGITEDKVKIIEQAFVETKMLAREYAKLSGKVVGSDEEKGLAGVTVTVMHKLNVYINYETTTNSKGEYSFDDLPATDYIVSFEKSKYKTEEKDLELSKDTNDFDCLLNRIEETDTKDSEIVFVMDISMSMDTSDPEDIRKQIISNIVSSLNSDSKVALVTFAANASLISDGLNNKNLNKKIIVTDIFNIANNDGHDDNAGTNGTAGLKTGLSLFSKSDDIRRYVVFLTDGVDNKTSDVTYSDLIKEANEIGVRILTIGLGGEDDLNEAELINIANGTNGKYYHATSSSKLYKFDKRIFDELN